jgi:hypothetical protein
MEAFVALEAQRRFVRNGQREWVLPFVLETRRRVLRRFEWNGRIYRVVLERKQVVRIEERSEGK